MIALRRVLPRHRLALALVLGLIGALGTVLAVAAVAAVANLLGWTALHDIGVNTGPAAAIGGAGAGVAAATDSDDPGTTTIIDQQTGQPRDPSGSDRLLWEIGRRMDGLPTDQERHDQIWSDAYDRMKQSYTQAIPEAPPAEPTTPYGDPLAEPPDQAGKFGAVGHPDPPGTGSAGPDPGPDHSGGGVASGGGREPINLP